jgi:hypothetical protein
MKLLKYLLIGLLVLILLALGGIYASGNGALLRIGWAMLFGGPALPFDAAQTVEAPDYADPANWAALPERDGLEDRVPEGIARGVEQGRAPVDVFFVHPTGFLAGDAWTFDMNPDSRAEENTRWMMANQASTYNGCCNIYAPRYRQASIFAYFRGEDVREQVLGFAYQDVARAFDYFIGQHNDGRPFVLASHSQGTHHGIRLLREKIDGTPLARRLVAAYLIGGGLKRAQFDGLADIALCDAPEQTGCAVHWDTWSEAAVDNDFSDSADNVCVNPLSWRLNGGLAEAEKHLGWVGASGTFQADFGADEGATGIDFAPLQAPVAQALSAQCRDGVLFITDQSDTPLGRTGGSFGGGNYHGLDYPAFHMNIRANAQARVAAFLAREN